MADSLSVEVSVSDVPNSFIAGALVDRLWDTGNAEDLAKQIFQEAEDEGHEDGVRELILELSKLYSPKT